MEGVEDLRKYDGARIGLGREGNREVGASTERLRGSCFVGCAWGAGPPADGGVELFSPRIDWLGIKPGLKTFSLCPRLGGSSMWQ